jgi:hypothetical protein
VLRLDRLLDRPPGKGNGPQLDGSNSGPRPDGQRARSASPAKPGIPVVREIHPRRSVRFERHTRRSNSNTIRHARDLVLRSAAPSSQMGSQLVLLQTDQASAKWPSRLWAASSGDHRAGCCAAHTGRDGRGLSPPNTSDPAVGPVSPARLVPRRPHCSRDRHPTPRTRRRNRSPRHAGCLPRNRKPSNTTGRTGSACRNHARRSPCGRRKWQTTDSGRRR